MEATAKPEILPDRGELIYVCSSCKRVKTNSGKWIVMSLGTDHRLSHGYCPPCARAWRKQAGIKGK